MKVNLINQKYKKFTFEIAIIISLAVISVNSAGLENSVALLNGQTKFNCSRPTTNNRTMWIFNPDSDPASGTAAEIVSYCIVQSAFTANYAVENGPDFCNLVITNINMTMAGIYSCQSFGGPILRAILTVLDPIVAVNVSDKTPLVEDKLVNISCSLRYSTTTPPFPRLIPYLSWIVPNGQIVTGNSSSTSTNLVVSYITVKVKRPILPSFQCYANFTLSGNPSGEYASNSPSSPLSPSSSVTVTDIAFLDVCFVNATDREVRFENSSCHLAVLTCSAFSNPPALYSWSDITDPQPSTNISNNQIYSLAEDKRVYDCTAYNPITGTECKKTYTVALSTTPPCSRTLRINCNDKETTTSCSCKNGTDVTLHCKAAGVFPDPKSTYWVDENGNILSNSSSYTTAFNGRIRCVGVSNIPEVKTTFRNVTIIECFNETEPSSSSEPSPISSTSSIHPDLKVILPAILVPWIGGNLIVTIIFLICYSRNESKKDGLNDKCNCLKKMLPCFNQSSSSDDCCCGSCVCVFFFLLISVLFGMIFFSTLFIICCCCQAKYGNSSRTKQPNTSASPFSTFENDVNDRDNESGSDVGNRDNRGNGTTGNKRNRQQGTITPPPYAKVDKFKNQPSKQNNAAQPYPPAVPRPPPTTSYHGNKAFVGNSQTEYSEVRLNPNANLQPKQFLDPTVEGSGHYAELANS